MHVIWLSPALKSRWTIRLIVFKRSSQSLMLLLWVVFNITVIKVAVATLSINLVVISNIFNLFLVFHLFIDCGRLNTTLCPLVLLFNLLVNFLIELSLPSLCVYHLFVVCLLEMSVHFFNAYKYLLLFFIFLLHISNSLLLQLKLVIL